MPEIMGPGIGLADLDDDGDLDIVMPDFGPKGRALRPKLWRQEPGGRFLECGQEAGLLAEDFGQGILVFDADGDGRLDLFFSNVGADRLYRNRGGMRFEEVTESSGLSGPAEWSTSAAAADLDGDGDLDLFVAVYLDFDPNEVCAGSGGVQDYCGPRSFPGLHDRLYRNDGRGRFTEISAEAGLRTGVPRHGLGVVCADLTGDGRMDIYVANDNDPNQLWVQGEPLQFREEALLRGIAVNEEGREQASMGLVLADFDRDGFEDLFATHLDGETNTLYSQGPAGEFRETTRMRGLATPSLPFTAFGAVAFDLECDGDLDLAVVNGHVFRGRIYEGGTLGPFWERYAQPAQLFLQDGGSFREAGALAGEFARRPMVGRGLARGDIDGDGDDDLVVSGLAEAPRIYGNEAPRKGHWLAVRAERGPDLMTAVGALLRLETEGGVQLARLSADGSYLSSSEPVQRFGLGPARAYRLQITWPNGQTEEVRGGDVDRELLITPPRRGG